MRSRTKKAIAVIGISLGISVLAFGFIWSLYVYQTAEYPIAISQEYLWRARATNDLYDMEFYLNKSLDMLKPFTGNPAWWFPKPDTDFDLIKQNIFTSAQTCKTIRMNSTPSDLGYQQAVQNLQETIIEINDHLDIARNYNGKTWQYLGPGMVITAIWILAFCIGGGVLFVETQEPYHSS